MLFTFSLNTAEELVPVNTEFSSVGDPEFVRESNSNSEFVLGINPNSEFVL